MTTDSMHTIIMDFIPVDIRLNIDTALNAIGDQCRYHDSHKITSHLENDKTYRYAYFYRFFICLSLAVKTCWDRLFHGEILVIHNKEELKMCCIGGFSGCDLFGFCQFLEMYHLKKKINAVILDRFDWSEETRNLLGKFNLSKEYNINFKFIKYIFPSEITDEIITEISSADIISVVNYTNVVGDHGDNIELFSNLFTHAKRSAFVFFMDRSNGTVTNTMKRAAKLAHLGSVNKLQPTHVEVPANTLAQMFSNAYVIFPVTSIEVNSSLYIQKY